MKLQRSLFNFYCIGKRCFSYASFFIISVFSLQSYAQPCEFYGFTLETSGFDCDGTAQGDICFETNGVFTSPFINCIDYIVELEYATGVFTVDNLGDFDYHSTGGGNTILRHEPSLQADGFSLGCISGTLMIPGASFVIRVLNPNPPNDIVSTFNFTIGNPPTIGSPGTATLLSSQIAPNGPLLPPASASTKGQRIKIEGTLIVDMDYEMGFTLPGFENNIAMGANARIEIMDNYTLTINRGDIYACSGQWDRINVQSGGTFVFNYSTLRDAIVGIEMHDMSNAFVFSSTLRNNETGIGCFDPGPQQPNLNMMGTPLLVNAIKDGITGIDFENAGLLTIVGHNIFQNLNTGILLNETDLDTDASSFFDCNTGIKNLSHNNLIRVNNSQFYNGFYDIYNAGSHIMEIGPSENTFFFNKKINIAKLSGQLYDYTLIEGSVFNSEFTNASLLTFPAEGYVLRNKSFSAGVNNINILGLMSSLPGNWNINFNDKMNAAESGNNGSNVRLLNTHGVRIFENLDMNSNDKNVWVEGGNQTNLRENILSGLSENIYLDNSGHTIVTCNTTSDAQTGLQVVGNCTRSSFQGNILSSNGFNLAYGTTGSAYAHTGIHENKGNRFDMSDSFNPKAINHSDNMTANLNQYIVALSVQGNNTFPFFTSNFNQWFFIGGVTDDSCPPTIDPEEENHILKTSREIVALLNAGIANTYGGEIAFGLMLDLYNNLRQLEQGDGIPADLQSWHTQLTNSPAAKIIAFEEAFANATTLSEEEKLAIDQYHSELNTLLDELHGWEWYNLDEQLNVTIDEVAYDYYMELKAAAKQKLEQAIAIKQARHNDFMGQLPLLTSLNNSITNAPLASVQNIKMANTLLLQRLSPTFNEFTESELNTLHMIAQQCPSLGGKGVYQARALWSEATEQFEQEYNDECLPASSLAPPAPSVEIHNETTAPLLLPNPTDDYTTLGLPLDHDYKQIEILDTKGQLVQQVRDITVDQQEIRLSTQGWPAGIYFVHLIGSNSTSLILSIH